MQNKALVHVVRQREIDERHYYRIQTLEFMIEYDKAREDGNRVHSGWSDFRNDRGELLLAAHMKNC